MSTTCNISFELTLDNLKDEGLMKMVNELNQALVKSDDLPELTPTSCDLCQKAAFCFKNNMMLCIDCVKVQSACRGCGVLSEDLFCERCRVIAVEKAKRENSMPFCKNCGSRNQVAADTLICGQCSSHVRGVRGSSRCQGESKGIVGHLGSMISPCDIFCEDKSCPCQINGGIENGKHIGRGKRVGRCLDCQHEENGMCDRHKESVGGRPYTGKVGHIGSICEVNHLFCQSENCGCQINGGIHRGKYVGFNQHPTNGGCPDCKLQHLPGGHKIIACDRHKICDVGGCHNPSFGDEICSDCNFKMTVSFCNASLKQKVEITQPRAIKDMAPVTNAIALLEKISKGEQVDLKQLTDTAESMIKAMKSDDEPAKKNSEIMKTILAQYNIS